MEETKPEGAAVRRTLRTEDVGRADARELATGPSWRRTAGSVGRAVTPARDALGRRLIVKLQLRWWRNLQLKQLRDIGLALVDLHNMPFYDETRGRSCQ